MTIQVTQCENCPFFILDDESENEFCNQRGDPDSRYGYVENSGHWNNKLRQIPTNCPLLTSDITVKLKQ